MRSFFFTPQAHGKILHQTILKPGIGNGEMVKKDCFPVILTGQRTTIICHPLILLTGKGMAGKEKKFNKGKEKV
jgi:hypothetical protein